MSGPPRALRPDAVASLVKRLGDLALADPSASQLSQLLLSSLRREDAERGNNLVATLRVYYASGARVDKTADALFLHRNSVRYRLDRVRLLVGLDIDQPHVIAALTVALASEQIAIEEGVNAG